jgi:hypothetical protein
MNAIIMQFFRVVGCAGQSSDFACERWSQETVRDWARLLSDSAYARPYQNQPGPAQEEGQRQVQVQVQGKYQVDPPSLVLFVDGVEAPTENGC